MKKQASQNAESTFPGSKGMPPLPGSKRGSLNPGPSDLHPYWVMIPRWRSLRGQR